MNNRDRRKSQSLRKESSRAAQVISPRTTSEKNLAVKATRRKLISVKLKKFLSARPSHEELLERKILQSPFGPSPPLRMSIFNKIVFAFEHANAIDTEGIFRISGNGETIRNLWCALASNTDPDFSSASPHDVAGVLKLYIRELEKPLVPYDHFQALLDSQRLAPPNSLVYIKKVVQLMPEENRLVLKALISLLEKISLNSAVNKMTTHNIAVCFGPNVMRSPKDGADVLNEIESQCAVVASMIDDRALIFGDTLPQSLSVPQLPSRPETAPNVLPPPLNLPPVLNLPPPVPLRVRGMVPTSLPPPPVGLPPQLSFNLTSPPPASINYHSSPQPNRPPPLRPVTPLHPVAPKASAMDDADYDEWSTTLIDDLSIEDKPVLAQKIAHYFTADGEQFRSFLRDIVGIDGVIALLETVV